MTVKLFIMRFRISFVFIILVTLILTSCEKSGRNEMLISVSSSNKTINELVTKVYDQSQLTEIEQSDYYYEKLNEEYPVECVRKEDLFYRVTYASKEHLLILTYDNTGKMLFHKQVIPTAKKSDLDTITVGINVFDVQNIDKSGEYHFLYTGTTETPKMSTHFTKDGYLYKISYNDDWDVIDIKYELI